MHKRTCPNTIYGSSGKYFKRRQPVYETTRRWEKLRADWARGGFIRERFVMTGGGRGYVSFGQNCSVLVSAGHWGAAGREEVLSDRDPHSERRCGEAREFRRLWLCRLGDWPSLVRDFCNRLRDRACRATSIRWIGSGRRRRRVRSYSGRARHWSARSWERR